MRRAVGRCEMNASTLRRAPQLLHAKTSTANERLKSSAHGSRYLLRPLGSDFVGSADTALDVGGGIGTSAVAGSSAGTTHLRGFAFGANIP